MRDVMLFPLVPASLVIVGMSLLLVGPWPIGLPVLVTGMTELFGVLLS